MITRYSRAIALQPPHLVLVHLLLHLIYRVAHDRRLLIVVSKLPVHVRDQIVVVFDKFVCAEIDEMCGEREER